MKAMKKLAAMILAVSLTIPVVGLQVEAADGTLMFTDPQTKVGENVSVDMVIQAPDTIGDVDITLNYDADALEFVSGTDVQSDGNGTLTYSHKGSGSDTELRTTLQFRALKQGEGNISVADHTAYLFSDESLYLSEGTSVVTIDVADDGSTSVEPTGSSESSGGAAVATDMKVSVNGMEYSFSEDFTVAVIPEGYSETMLPYSGAERKFVRNNNGVTLGYLVDTAGKAAFYLYNEENATFAPFVEMHISDETSIILLNEPDKVSLPEQYQLAELQVGDHNFPAWQDMEHDGYYVMYALNTTTDTKELYRYDTVDGTYQRLIKETEQKEDTATLADDGTMLGKIKNLVYEHFMIFVALGAVLALGILILLIVLSVKLYHRNAELDDLYEEYDIPDELPEEKPSKKSKKQSKKASEDDFYDDDFDEEYDDEEYDDEYEYEDEYEDSFEDTDDYNDDFEGDDFDEEYDDDFDDDDFEDDEEEVVVKKKNGKKQKGGKKSDPFEIDFIDL